MTDTPTFIFFGGEPLGVPALESLHSAGLTPTLIVCNPDRPRGRTHELAAPPVKIWALAHDIPVFQPEKIDTAAIERLTAEPIDLFVVVAYNHILPKQLLEHPTHDTLNLHPSLLPLLRGASPIRTAILEDHPDAVGVSIIKLDAKMDHGPIVAQEVFMVDEPDWPIRGQELDRYLANVGGELLAETIPAWIAGAIEPQEQDHNAATYCSRLNRADGELEIDPHALPHGDSAWHALLKIRAFDGFPGTFFIYNGKRIKITDAELVDETLVITSVIPEGKTEQSFAQFLQSLS